jgi:hypothetical protein
MAWLLRSHRYQIKVSLSYHLVSFCTCWGYSSDQRRWRRTRHTATASATAISWRSPAKQLATVMLLVLWYFAVKIILICFTKNFWKQAIKHSDFSNHTPRTFTVQNSGIQTVPIFKSQKLQTDTRIFTNLTSLLQCVAVEIHLQYAIKSHNCCNY